jgi:hypothetical protein
MHHKEWLNSRKRTTNWVPRRILEDRIVFCVDCDANRPLTTNGLGQLVCSACTSAAWMYVAAPLVANFQRYSEGVAEANAAGNAFAHTCPVL